ncbi:MAG: hypothetical protein DKINENOH_00305 [bacterium]|nr:hypothetical protein [bacterium]MCL4708987.1 hypothetical protein [bacterium]
MGSEWWKPQKPQPDASDLLIEILLRFVLKTISLYLGLKAVGVKDTNIGKVIWISLIGPFIIPQFLEFILKLAGLFNETFSIFLGFFVVVFIIQAMFDEEFSPALFATLLAYGFYFGTLWFIGKSG